MRRLNGMDAMLLYSETPNLHTHTLKVAVLDASGLDFGFEDFRAHLRRKLEVLEPLCYKLIETPGRLHHPLWLECDADDIDLDYHVRRVQIPSPGGRRELDRAIGEIASTPLDRSRPLWEFYFAEGLAGDQFAVIGKVHHSLADGVASANLLARLMDLTDASVPDYQCSTTTSTGLIRLAARDHVRQLRELPGLIKDAVRGFTGVRRRAAARGRHRELATQFDAPPTFLNHWVAPSRRFASAPLPLAEVKATAAELEVTVNDLILAIAAGGLRTLLLDYDGAADRPIIASVPTATDKSDRVWGNEISGLMVSLPVHIADPVERVRLVALATRLAKEDHEIMGARLYGRLMNYLPAALAPMAFRWLGRQSSNRMMNVAVSSVMGPRSRGHLGGAPVREIYSTGVLSPGAPVNITVWSYADRFGIAVLTDDQTFADEHDATDALVAAFDEIRSAAIPYATLSA